MDRAGRRLRQSAVCDCYGRVKLTSPVIRDTIGGFRIRDGIGRIRTHVVHFREVRRVLYRIRRPILLRRAQGW